MYVIIVLVFNITIRYSFPIVLSRERERIKLTSTVFSVAKVSNAALLSPA